MHPTDQNPKQAQQAVINYIFHNAFNNIPNAP